MTISSVPAEIREILGEVKPTTGNPTHRSFFIGPNDLFNDITPYTQALPVHMRRHLWVCEYYEGRVFLGAGVTLENAAATKSPMFKEALAMFRGMNALANEIRVEYGFRAVPLRFRKGGAA